MTKVAGVSEASPTWWQTAARRWGRLRALSWAERWLLVQAAVLLPVLALGVRLAGLQRCQATLRRLTPAAPPRPDRLDQAQAAARLVGVAARHGLYRATCLPQALTLWWLLRRQGIDCDLRLGVRRDGAAGLEAHAWVELRGQVLGDRPDLHEKFTAFERKQWWNLSPGS